MSPLLRIISLVGAIVVLGTCSDPGQPPCAPGVGSPMAVFGLYFGKAIPGRGELTEKEWLSFLDDTITPGLPNGYTVLDANGAWMNPITRKTIKEGTKVLIVALPQVPQSLAAINRIRSDYQIRFHQQLVGMTVEQACGTF